MVNQKPSRGHKPANKTRPVEAHKGRKTSARSAVTMATRRQASARNLEEEREKGGERMMRHRAAVSQDTDRLDEFRARAREASRRFREKNGPALAHRQQVIRLQAYEKKHGHRAWLERYNLQEERRAEEQEREEDRHCTAEIARILGPMALKAPLIFVSLIQVFLYCCSLLVSLMPPAGAGHCEPRYWCEVGHEDPDIFCAQGRKLYVVTRGTVCGIFSSELRARKQVEGISNGSMQKPPSSPLALMDAVEAFSRMGVPDPAAPEPVKQWVIAGINKFFANRIDAIDHIFTVHRDDSRIMGSRNVKKLRTHIRGVKCERGVGDVEDSDDE
ncbi:hypothetical protein K438DRAFT_1785799 [Mycena galopus ATCC 62051]|nr:hypothetical protein K438DRAFT_1785799 [Mycena galopus ATCC 62051]